MCFFLFSFSSLLFIDISEHLFFFFLALFPLLVLLARFFVFSYLNSAFNRKKCGLMLMFGCAFTTNQSADMYDVSIYFFLVLRSYIHWSPFFSLSLLLCDSHTYMQRSLTVLREFVFVCTAHT